MEVKAVAVAAAMVVVAALLAPAAGQAVAASCTASLITSFTPCFNFVTGSSGGGNGTAGSTPTADCCRSLAALIDTSAGCACLVLTGNVPLGIPINRTLAVTLPRACNSMSVPLQCKDTSAQIPGAGVPVAVSPALPPLPPSPPATPEAGSPTTSPAVPAATPPATSQTQTRPQVVPSSAWMAAARLPAFLLLLPAVLF
ncbi:non-specific lipid transfer protein GPI-anchored 20-like [Oryza brachyantha]|uniref:non-specific lipid transfer protein GPI-anchored 20-like n=1 Tax=Oryza brachyantha TaxID=4533 RepID=UPI001ADA4EFE|nr:non-specific lipid transfer protein GPI-anchored 20-like [Oryza brachyantha]